MLNNWKTENVPSLMFQGEPEDNDPTQETFTVTIVDPRSPQYEVAKIVIQVVAVNPEESVTISDIEMELCVKPGKIRASKCTHMHERCYNSHADDRYPSYVQNIFLYEIHT